MIIIKQKLINLINVKSIVTILLTILFCILSINGSIDSNAVTTIYTTVIAFYFGTQVEKKGELANENHTEFFNSK